jgi:hypothetical protein
MSITWRMKYPIHGRWLCEYERLSAGDSYTIKTIFSRRGSAMRILSIDLPWSSKSGTYGFAWVDLAASTDAVVSTVQQGSASESHKILEVFASKHGSFDVVLIDQPIGLAPPPPKSAYRDVERAFGNSSFVNNGAQRIQFPRFQPGAAHVAHGLANAECAKSVFGNAKTVIVEVFPQLSIPPLIRFSQQNAIEIHDVTRPGSHKQNGVPGRTAGFQLIRAFSEWTELAVVGAAQDGQPDAVDAVLALLPALEHRTG